MMMSSDDFHSAYHILTGNRKTIAKNKMFVCYIVI